MQELDQLLEKGVSEKVFTGASALAILDGKILYKKSVGHDGTEEKKPVSEDSCFDLASLTKILATTLVAMRLVGMGSLSLETPLHEILSEWKKRREGREIRIFHLLQHTSGLPPFLEFFRELALVPPEKRKMERRRLLFETGLLHKPGKVTLYSDLGFMLLKEIFEEITGKPFESLVMESMPPDILKKEALFFPSEEDRGKRRFPFVATSFSTFRNRRLYGEVHDENAAVIGGVDAHAGLFGTASGVGLFAEALLESFYGKSSWLSSEVTRQFIFWPKDGKRPYGFDRPSVGNSSSGRFFSIESIGHLGFTGTSLWMDMKRRLSVVLLSNRVYYGDDNWKIRDFRPVFHDLLVKTCGL